MTYVRSVILSKSALNMGIFGMGKLVVLAEM